MAVVKKTIMKERQIIGRVIRTLRRGQAEDITQKDVSKSLGFSQPVFQQRIETGKRHLDVAELWEICKFLNLSFTEVAAQIEKALIQASED